jgi:hypothetical protein
MKVGKNRPMERKGVNAARSLFEAAGCLFQEVDTRNDFGKDAYVDLTEDGVVTGDCIGVQVKSGETYRRKNDYVIPVTGHVECWRNSPLPIAGIVYDPDIGSMFWCDLTEACRRRSLGDESPVGVPADHVLDADTLESAFKPYFIAAARAVARESVALNLLSEDAEVQGGATFDCLALGRGDPRFLVLLRCILPHLRGLPRLHAIHVLSHVTPHPDILWTAKNWVPEESCRRVCEYLRWSPTEVLELMEAVDGEGWHRGGIGQSLFMLLVEDPGIGPKLRRAAIEAVRRENEDVAWMALYVHLYLRRGDARAAFEDVLAEEPALRHLDLIPELRQQLQEGTPLCLFE